MTDLRIIPFGGVRENGKNMYAVSVNDEIFILDAGLKYPETEQLGIDVVIPDFEYLVNNQEKIAGIFLTHGHADSIGALPYLLQQLQVPIFGSELTIALAKLAIQDEADLKAFDDFHVVNENTEIDFGAVKVSFFNTTHTIPEALGVVLGTDEGQIVYTGHFKFDQTAEASYQTNYARLAEIGAKPVLALLADAAGTEDIGKPMVSEKKIHQYVEDSFVAAKGKRIIVAVVASNIQRVQQVIDATAKTHRRLIFSGQDVEQIVHAALNLGKLNLPMPKEELFADLKDLETLPAGQIVVLETGKMGEPVKNLHKMAKGENPNIRLGDSDLVFIATTPSFAVESYVAQTRNLLFQQGADVKQISTDLRSSGHGSAEDVQMMINFMKPEFFFPVSGEFRVMVTAKAAAEEVNIPAKKIIMAKRGDQYVYDGQTFEKKGGFTIGETMIDGDSLNDIGNVVLRDRRILSEDGVFVTVVTIDRKKRKVVSKPKMTSRGFVYVKANRDLMKEAGKLTIDAIEDYLKNAKAFDWNELKNGVRESLSRFLFNETRRRPMVMPVVMEVNQNRRPHHTKGQETTGQKGKKANGNKDQKKGQKNPGQNNNQKKQNNQAKQNKPKNQGNKAKGQKNQDQAKKQAANQ
ncbi:ribonuclease J [Fructobacillus tropaeoli]|uniref:mRNA degradation ribonuclease J1/J2 (RnjA) n=1 Tax=Fructobacillus tropaeoli TaxID=709323 RepID=A0ABN9YNI2_9LACO|nr:ribonuclease J [Fructobacillus tropaeoli]GIC69675.1 ribonuclease J [Fructobacillus tropaeoli]CAK1234794.1 mRNA degradation ribonuclease J1/J2 (RnjA) [Fructobacillus tropaeoli]CAK1235303.1 mRNA degradation ribonuclease J1/J2 (RnjA) [Fructobacillus tropaeoli]CAK1238325.1 mRNA degradation ribonuclease J1/J2 (RnjA) [Fructobacillus tropaeoli]